MIEFENVRKVYPQGPREVAALDGVTLQVEKGEFVAIMGPSGSGKSTLLHLAGGLDLPSSGAVRLEGKSTLEMSDDDLTLYRRKRIGFIFQFFNLIPTLTVVENTVLPLLLNGGRLHDVRPRAEALLERVGLRPRLEHRPDELSGGEMQRVAIARALLADPAMVLADEPTGNLDSAAGAEVLRILKELAGERTLVMVTHDPSAAAVAGKIVRLKDGRVV
jgi:putative ABC transport system ATP-binding protein